MQFTIQFPNARTALADDKVQLQVTISRRILHSNTMLITRECVKIQNKESNRKREM